MLASAPSPGHTPDFDVFLSYNSRDTATVERIAERLKRAGLEPWIDRWALTPGVDWQSELGAGLDAAGSCAIFVGPDDLGAWELQEVAVAIDRAAKQRGFRVFAVLLPGVAEPFDPNRLPHFLRTRTWVDFRRGRENGRALQDLINAIKGVPFGPDAPLRRDEDVVPYRGLRVFGEEDAPFFFGRDREIQRLLEQLKAGRFLAVLGPSGSGKSSLVRAGLVPALRAGALAPLEHRHVRVLRPGAAPLTALAAQLASLGGQHAMQATLDALESDPRTLHLAVELALADRAPSERALVVVDQLEEVFTLCGDESQRRRLFATLLYATSAPGGRTDVIVTLRADFYARCVAHPELAQVIAANQMLLGPMDADGLRQAIEEPARRVGLELEEGLSETILADAGAEPGALPLLEHALLELWERRRHKLLTLEAYREAGGVSGALAQRADAIFGELSAAQQQIARRMLLRLTQPGEGTEDTRRRVTRRELAPAEPGDDFEEVLGRLIDARLLTAGSDETGVEVVDVAHEALIRGWPRLRGWIEADRAGLLVHHRLSDAAREWDAVDREAPALYRGARLAAASEWARDHCDDLTGLERAFLGAAEAAERRELAAARNRTRRLRILASGMAALAALVALLAVWALDQRDDAQGQRSTALRQTAEATSLTLSSAALSSSLIERRPQISLLLALEANRASSRAEARNSGLAALVAARGRGVLAILHGHTDLTFDATFSPDGRTLASAGADGTIRWWDARTRKPLGPPVRGHAHGVLSVAFSPDGRTLASTGGDDAIRLWDARTHKPLGSPLRGHTSSVYDAAFSPDGRTLASGGGDTTVRLWDVRRRRQRGAALKGHEGAIGVVAFDRSGRTLASGDGDTTRLWDVRSGRPRGRPLQSGSGGVAFSPDGRTLAFATPNKAIRLWDVRARKPRGTPLTGHADGIEGVTFSPDGRTLAAAGDDKTIRLWDVRTHRRRGAPLTGHSGRVGSVEFSPDGRTLASTSMDTTIRLWDVRPAKALGAPLAGHAGPVRSVAFGADGESLASAGDDKTIRLWDVLSRKPLGAPLTGHATPVRSVAFSPDGRTLASVGERALASRSDAVMRLWNVATRTALGGPLTDHSFGGEVAFSRDGRTVATPAGDFDRTIRLWDVRTHQPQDAALTGHTDAIEAVAFSPDGRTLASGSRDGTARLWNLRAAKQIGGPLHDRDGQSGLLDWVKSVAFSPDGRVLASAAGATVRFWDVRRRKPLGAPLSRHLRSVTSVAFSPDGRTLASASTDHAIRLWDVRSRKPIGVLVTADAVNDVAFSRDGRTLASANADGTVRMWGQVLWHSFAELRTAVCSIVGGDMTRAEWGQYANGIAYRRSCS